jgi:hypothetical protein
MTGLYWNVENQSGRIFYATCIEMLKNKVDWHLSNKKKVDRGRSCVLPHGYEASSDPFWDDTVVTESHRINEVLQIRTSTAN